MHGLFVQRPFASSLVHGRKTIETRSYKLPEHMFGKLVYIIETPRREHRRTGDRGMIVGVVRFDGWKLYTTRDEWLLDADRHLVAPDDPLYGWRDDKPKYGWTVASLASGWRDNCEPLEPSQYRGTGYGRVWVTDCEQVEYRPIVQWASR
jgi:hypothetical protein